MSPTPVPPPPPGGIAKGFAIEDPDPYIPDQEFKFETDHYEMQGYPKSEWREGEFRAVRKVRVAWDKRMALLIELNSAQGRLYPYPDGPYYVIDPNIIVPLAVAVGVKCEPLLAEQRADTDLATFTGFPVAEYDFALITVQYSNRGSSRLFDGMEISESVEPRKIYDTVVPAGKLHWGSGTGPLLKQQIGRVFTGLEYVMTIDRMLDHPTNVMAFVGQVNQSPVFTYTLDLDFLAGTLLYDVPTLSRSATWGGLERWKVVYRLGWHPWGWNNFYRLDGANGPGFYPVYLADGTRYMQYPEATVGGF